MRSSALGYWSLAVLAVLFSVVRSFLLFILSSPKAGVLINLGEFYWVDNPSSESKQDLFTDVWEAKKSLGSLDVRIENFFDDFRTIKLFYWLEIYWKFILDIFFDE